MLRWCDQLVMAYGEPYINKKLKQDVIRQLSLFPCSANYQKVIEINYVGKSSLCHDAYFWHHTVGRCGKSK